MKRESKSGQGAAEKEENLGEKLRRGVWVGKRRGPTTPIVSSWRFWPSKFEEEARGCIIKGEEEEENATTTHVSARKLAAALWEFHQYQYHNLPISKMQHRGGNNVNANGVSDSRIRRHRQHQHQNQHHHHYKEKGLDFSHFLVDPTPSSPDQPESASSLRRHIAQSLIQHHRSIERNHRALQPVSPASYGSSMEMAPYNPAVTPSSSLDFKGRVGESHYNLKTSTELLKVLNRIWSLEEQHASNVLHIRALKTDLDHSRARIKELLRDQQADRHEIDDLMKQNAEDKLVRKSKEQDRIHAAVQSVRDELEDERKLRKRSESLHRKLARDLSEVKSSLSNALKELERERKSRKLLEDLCDEFAEGIKDYEQEVHAWKQKSDKDWAGTADRDILHISESWLDERMQMKLEEAQTGVAEKNSIVDKLGFEIETFLQDQRMCSSKKTNNTLPRDRRNSLESVPLHEAVSAPQDAGDDDDSAGSDSYCFELNKPNNGDLKSPGGEAVDNRIDETVKHSQTRKHIASRDRTRGRLPSNLQVKFEEQMARATSNGNKAPQMVDEEQEDNIDGKQIEISISHKSENRGASEDDSHVRKNEHDDVHGANSNYMTRNRILVAEAGSIHPEINDSGEASCSYPAWRNQASPVRPWMSDISESSTKLPPALKDNTLKSKLLELRSMTAAVSFRWILQLQLHKDVPKAARFYSESGPLKLTLMQSASDHVTQKGYSSLLCTCDQVEAMRWVDGHMLGLYEPA
ncbi:hypothetical protein Q3G72_024529 [Acer saccharum]|nr:hypothetical protein Q3G72_024529 [Acer saccharum]